MSMSRIAWDSVEDSGEDSGETQGSLSGSQVSAMRFNFNNHGSKDGNTFVVIIRVLNIKQNYFFQYHPEQ